MSPSVVAKNLGYTEQEVLKAMDGRLFLDKNEKESIAKLLDVSLSEMINNTDNINEQSNGCIEYRGSFSTEENRDFILDLFDAYCDIQEMLDYERKSHL